jgi:mRNA-degrading endonuclease RelE of RelBE toxin-antitoxin system
MDPRSPRREVVLTRTAARGVERLPEHVRTACGNVLRRLASGAERGKALKGELTGLRSMRLGQGFRLLYRETEDRIEVIDVGPRGDIYKR